MSRYFSHGNTLRWKNKGTVCRSRQFIFAHREYGDEDVTENRGCEKGSLRVSRSRGEKTRSRRPRSETLSEYWTNTAANEETFADRLRNTFSSRIQCKIMREQIVKGRKREKGNYNNLLNWVFVGAYLRRFERINFNFENGKVISMFGIIKMFYLHKIVYFFLNIKIIFIFNRFF